MEKIYFDYAATTPVDPKVIKAIEPYLYDNFANPSSPHSLGRDALKALEDSRAYLAQTIGAQADEIVFNSGATEGNNHAIFGCAQISSGQRKHIIISAIEHHSCLEPIEYLKSQGYDVTYIGVDECGLIDMNQLQKSITDKTMLVVVMHASNEIGTIQSIKEISEVTKEEGIPLLVDACQTVGHLPVNVNDLGCDLMSLSAHKFYGPKGIGALYIRKGTKIGQIMMGGDQERSRRASTVNVSGAVGLAKALEIAIETMQEESQFQTTLRNRLIHEVPKLIDGVKVNGDLNKRLFNNAHFSFEGLQGESLLMSLDMVGVCASMGSACTSGAMEVSHVLKAIGLDEDLALGSLRLSVGRFTKESDVDQLLNMLPDMVKSLRI